MLRNLKKEHRHYYSKPASGMVAGLILLQVQDSPEQIN
jgi:hypothetical protein